MPPGQDGEVSSVLSSMQEHDINGQDKVTKIWGSSLPSYVMRSLKLLEIFSDILFP